MPFPPCGRPLPFGWGPSLPSFPVPFPFPLLAISAMAARSCTCCYLSWQRVRGTGRTRGRLREHLSRGRRAGLGGVAARASFSGLGREKLREFGLRGSVWLLPAFDFGLGFGKRAATSTNTATLPRNRFGNRGLQGSLSRDLRRGPSSRRRGDEPCDLPVLVWGAVPKVVLSVVAVASRVWAPLPLPTSRSWCPEPSAGGLDSEAGRVGTARLASKAAGFLPVPSKRLAGVVVSRRYRCAQ